MCHVDQMVAAAAALLSVSSQADHVARAQQFELELVSLAPSAEEYSDISTLPRRLAAVVQEFRRSVGNTLPVPTVVVPKRVTKKQIV